MDSGGPPGGAASLLVGRVAESALIDAFLEGVRGAGGGEALLLTGMPGIGKTALLTAGGLHAANSGMRVMRTTGAELEFTASFAALSQLLQPLAAGSPELTTLFSVTLRAARAEHDQPAMGQKEVNHALLELLRCAGASSPTLVIADDVGWLDRPSATALCFAGRRLQGSRVGLLAAARTGAGGVFDVAGLPEHEVAPLDEKNAARLLEWCAPNLHPRVRCRLLDESQGNPLALRELAVAVERHHLGNEAGLPKNLPLTEKLRAAFAWRIAGLPTASRHPLLVAALEGTGDLMLIQRTLGPGALEDLATAERDGLIQVNDRLGRITFAHPLTSSAVIELSVADERRAAHQALAEQLSDQPDRQALHLGYAARGPDEHAAGLLRDAAYRILARGDAPEAANALTLAASLSETALARSRRLAEAAFMSANVSGDFRAAAKLLDDGRTADPGLHNSPYAAATVAYLMINRGDDVTTAHRILTAALNSQAADATNPSKEPYVEAVRALSQICWLAGKPALWHDYDQHMKRLGTNVPKDLALQTKTFADPVRTARPVLDELDQRIDSLTTERDPLAVVRTTVSAVYLDRLGDCRGALRRVADQARDGGALTQGIVALVHLCVAAFHGGDWNAIDGLADEGSVLCRAQGLGHLLWQFDYHRALVAAARGEFDRATALVDDIDRWAALRSAHGARHHTSLVRALAALGCANGEEAYRHTTAISPAGTFAPYTPTTLWAVLDTVEAATLANKPGEARAHAAAIQTTGIEHLSSRLALVAGGAVALAATRDDSIAFFEKALNATDAERWPFDLARVRLCFGERLRRLRHITRARTQLLAAYELFSQLEAAPWAERAQAELRACGAAAVSKCEEPRLTSQELRIARLAATGLTDKQIGTQLFLSPRTVSTHLHHVYPKLGISTRGALRDALASMEPDSDDEQALPRVLRGEMMFTSKWASDASALLTQWAQKSASLNPYQARELYLEALSTALFAGRLIDSAGVLDVAKAAASAPPPSQRGRPADLLLDGLTAFILDGANAGTPLIQEALDAFCHTELSADDGTRWLWLACHGAILVWNHEAWQLLSARQLALARQVGDPRIEPVALHSLSAALAWSGDFTASRDLITQAQALAEATGNALFPYATLPLAAWQGHEIEAKELAQAARNSAVARGEGMGLASIEWATALLCNGLGQYEDALTTAQHGAEHPQELWTNFLLPELVEAAVGCGQTTCAAEAVDLLAQSTRASRTDWARGTEARSRALVSSGETAERLYREAIDRLDRTQVRTAAARARLIYGEWLGREGRGLHARDQLRQAHEMFTKIGMEAFARRASLQLQATSE
jgi:DNA-binding CsgD family transcriptional regulator